MDNERRTRESQLSCIFWEDSWSSRKNLGVQMFKDGAGHSAGCFFGGGECLK